MVGNVWSWVEMGGDCMEMFQDSMMTIALLPKSQMTFSA